MEACNQRAQACAIQIRICFSKINPLKVEMPSTIWSSIPFNGRFLEIDFRINSVSVLRLLLFFPGSTRINSRMSMASIGIPTRGNHPIGVPLPKSDKISSAVSLPITNRRRRIHPQRVHASNSSVSFSDPDGVYLKKTDSWMTESVAEIVKNLPRAPLLVQIHAAEGGRTHRIQIDEAMDEEWASVRRRWESGEAKSPDGVIVVGELKEDEDEKSDEMEEDTVTSGWGVVVQGRGADCGPACYLLKTDKARGGRGMDHCVHFCLMRTNNLRSSYMEQFKDSWLLK